MIQPHSVKPVQTCLALPGPPPWLFQAFLPLFISLEVKNQQDLLLTSLLQISCKPHTVQLFICMPTCGQWV